MAGACILSFITRATHKTSSIIVLCKASALLFLFLNSMRVQCCDSSLNCAQYFFYSVFFRSFFIEKKKTFYFSMYTALLIAVVMLYACSQGFNHAVHINSMYISLCEQASQKKNKEEEIWSRNGVYRIKKNYLRIVTMCAKSDICITTILDGHWTLYNNLFDCHYMQKDRWRE